MQVSQRRLSWSSQGPHSVRCDTAATPSEDKHQWLEEVQGDKALAWVRSQNQRTVQAFGDPEKAAAYKRILDALDSKEKIAYLSRMGVFYYNIWKDAEHPQGLWRRTTLESYRGGSPEWETVLDLDALSREEGVSWVWGGKTALDEGDSSTWDRVLLHLSPGGSDAVVVREFDVVNKAFVPESAGGFVIPEAKTRVCYRTRDELLLGTDFGEGSMTASGYPRTVCAWQRGTPLSAAQVVYEGKVEDVAVGGHMYSDRGHWHEFLNRGLNFFANEKYYRRGDPSIPAHAGGPFVKLPLPDDAGVSTFADACLVKLRSDWSVPGGPVYKAGSLLSLPIDDLVESKFSEVQVLFEPTERCSLPREFPAMTKRFLVVTVMDNVKKALQFWEFVDGLWVKRSEDGDCLPVGSDVSVGAVWGHGSDDIWITQDGFLQPESLQLASAADCAAKPENLAAKPATFDAAGLLVEQRMADSLDGTKVPYFVVRRSDAPLNGSSPTILDGYGGFQISRLPHYSTVYGIGWLERGGVYVLANIRGGGEFGPSWHQAAKREKRHKAYEDFEAVARDLVRTGVTSTERLACTGGSNGGMLVGNMLAREGANLFGAVICRVPLLDMWRYNKLLAGASWVAEYGNPDKPEDWAFLRAFSPYHTIEDSLRPGSGWGGCPNVLFTTSTKDDRVHPAHARKMVSKLSDSPEAAPKVFYWENIEGGHGGAANNPQSAYMWALTFEFLWNTIGKGHA